MTTADSSTLHDGTAPAGALTAVFTPPNECVRDIDLYYKTRTCMPSPDRWSLYWGAASYYSPGICPSGMISVAPPPPFFGPPVEPGETAIICCPSDYTLRASDTENWCEGTISISQYSVVHVTSLVTISATTSTDISLSRSYYDTTTSDDIYPIQVRWRESDLVALETHPLSPGVTPTSTGNSDIGGDDGGNESVVLSDGAIAGIVVGSVVAVALICIAGILCCRRQRSLGSRDISSSFSAPDKQSADISFIPTGDERIDAEIRRITARRARLQELEQLEEEEAQLRRQTGSGMAELGSNSTTNLPMEIGQGPSKTMVS